MTEAIIAVAAGILRDPAGRVLLAQRPPGRHAAGYWEFPGGKLAAGETPEQALARELEEEIGIEVGLATPFMSFRHDYAERSVLLHVFLVERFAGLPRGIEGQLLRWVTFGELASAGLLPADLPIAAELARRYG